MTETKIPVENYRDFCGAHERNRTFTPLRMADFESAASTNSATWAIFQIQSFNVQKFNVETFEPLRPLEFLEPIEPF